MAIVRNGEGFPGGASFLSIGGKPKGFCACMRSRRWNGVVGEVAELRCHWEGVGNSSQELRLGTEAAIRKSQEKKNTKTGEGIKGGDRGSDTSRATIKIKRHGVQSCSSWFIHRGGA